MSYSKNIERLIFKDDFTPQEIVRYAKDNIRFMQDKKKDRPIIIKIVLKDKYSYFIKI